MQNGIGRTAHRNIQRHGVFKRGFAGDVTRQCTFVILLVIAFSQFNNPLTGIEEQLLPVSMGRQQRTVARLRQAQRFGQAVHGVSGKHAGAGAAGWTGGTLHLVTLIVRDFRVRSLNHGINQIQLDNFV